MYTAERNERTAHQQQGMGDGTGATSAAEQPTLPDVPPPPATVARASRGTARPVARHAVAWASLVLVLVAALGGGVLLLGTGGALVATRGETSGQLSDAAAPIHLDASAVDLQQAVIDVVRSVQPSVVEVRSGGMAGQHAVGSGNIVSADGYIVTNDHVVRGFGSYEVRLASGKSYTARLVGEAPQDDLALLKIDATGLRPIAFAPTRDVHVGQFVLALGSPLGLQQSATFGIVSALDRTASEGPGGPASVLVGLIQTSAPINPGNSGGALVNLRGELVGVPTLGAVGNGGQAADGIGFAIPADRVRFVVDQLMRDGRVTNSGQGFLGIQGVDVTPDLARADGLAVQHGVRVIGFATTSDENSPARQADIRVGDILIEIEGIPIAGSADLAAALLPRAPGSSIAVTLVRGDERIHATVTLGERPSTATRG